MATKVSFGNPAETVFILTMRKQAQRSGKTQSQLLTAGYLVVWTLSHPCSNWTGLVFLRVQIRKPFIMNSAFLYTVAQLLQPPSEALSPLAHRWGQGRSLVSGKDTWEVSELELEPKSSDCKSRVVFCMFLKQCSHLSATISDHYGSSLLDRVTPNASSSHLKLL